MGMRRQLRYRFDNLMSRGTSAQIGLLGVFTVLLIVITAILVVIAGAVPQTKDSVDESFGRLAWRALTHTLDPGTLGNDDPTGEMPFLFIMLFVTIGGIFIVSSLIGVLNQGF